MRSKMLIRGGLLAAVACSMWVLAADKSFAQTPVRTAVLTRSADDAAIQTAQYTPAEGQPIVQPVHWGRGWGWGRPYYYAAPSYAYYPASAPYVTYYPPAPYVTNYYPAPYTYNYYPRRFVYRGGYYR